MNFVHMNYEELRALALAKANIDKTKIKEIEFRRCIANNGVVVRDLIRGTTVHEAGKDFESDLVSVSCKRHADTYLRYRGYDGQQFLEGKRIGHGPLRVMNLTKNTFQMVRPVPTWQFTDANYPYMASIRRLEELKSQQAKSATDEQRWNRRFKCAMFSFTTVAGVGLLAAMYGASRKTAA
ncbi:MAG: hypothetical protein ACYCOU_10010 [Sulfobacillus sp.]